MRTADRRLEPATMQDVMLTLPTLPDMELTASKTACAMGEHIRMSRDKIEEVQMAVVEATINAFEHSGTPDRQVSIHFRVLGADEETRGLEITVRDAGVGIPDDKLPAGEDDGDAKPLFPHKRGYGLKIIAGLMDEVDIRSNVEGTTIVMKKMC